MVLIFVSDAHTHKKKVVYYKLQLLIVSWDWVSSSSSLFVFNCSKFSSFLVCSLVQLQQPHPYHIHNISLLFCRALNSLSRCDFNLLIIIVNCSLASWLKAMIDLYCVSFLKKLFLFGKEIIIFSLWKWKAFLHIKIRVLVISLIRDFLGFISWFSWFSWFFFICNCGVRIRCFNFLSRIWFQTYTLSLSFSYRKSRFQTKHQNLMRDSL